MDAKTRRLLKVKQSQQAAQDTSVASVANKQTEENVVTPKVWIKDLTLPGDIGLVTTIPSFIVLENILSIQMMVNVKSADASWYYISIPSDTGQSALTCNFSIKVIDRGLYCSPALGTSIRSKDAKLTIFYI